MFQSKIRLLAAAASAAIAVNAPSQGLNGDQGIRFAGGGAQRQTARVKPRSVPFHTLPRTLPFAPLLPSKADFIEMGAFVADLTPEVAPGLKKTTTAVQLNYGYRKGGIACVYEMTKQPSMAALATVQATIKAHVFKERQYFKGWTIQAVPNKNLFLVVSGTTPEVLEAMKRALSKS